MARIAFCDDDPAFLEKISRLLDEYCKKREWADLEYEAFSDPFCLSEALDKGKSFDIYLLDVFLPNMTGISLAQEMRRSGITAPLIYLSTSKDYALEAFGVGAVQYLLKPVKKEKLFAALDAAMEKVNSARRRQVVIKTNGTYQNISIFDILYIEAHNKTQEIVLLNSTRYSVRQTLSELLETLSPYPDFVPCGAAFIINLSHVRSLEPKYVFMKKGMVIKIPRGAFPELKSRYLKFYAEG